MRTHRAVGLVLAGLLTSGCATQILTPPHEQFEGRFIDRVEPRNFDENLFGSKIEARAIHDQPHSESTLDTFGGWSLVAAPRAEREVEKVLGKLLGAFPHETPDVQVFVTSQRTFHAYATPYNDIFVSLGALEKVHSEDEMAFLVGHETAHLLLGHFERENVISMNSKVTKVAAGTAAMASMLAHTDFHRVEGKPVEVVVSDQSALNTSVTLAAISYLAVQELSTSVFDPAWKRHQEDEADLLAMDLMARAGYAPNASAETLERLGAIEADKERIRTEKLARHRKTYAPMMLAGAQQGGIDSALKTGAAVVAGEGLRAFNRVRDRMRSSHHSAEKRRERVTAYYRREYRSGDLAVSAGPAGGSFHARLWQGARGEVLRHHVDAHDALAALEAGETGQAEQLGLRAISGSTSRAPFPRFAMYQIRRAQGRHRQALENLEAVRYSPNVSGAVLVSLGEEYLAQNQPKEALAVAEEGRARFDTAEPFLPIEVAAWVALKDQEGLDKALERCERTEKKSVERACRRRVPEEMRTPTAPSQLLKSLLEGRN